MKNVRNSNWGRWGVEDERGTLNMLTSEHVGQAMRIPSQGKVYSLGAPVGREGPIGLRNTTHHYMSIIDNDPSPGVKGPLMTSWLLTATPRHTSTASVTSGTTASFTTSFRLGSNTRRGATVRRTNVDGSSPAEYCWTSPR